MNPLPLLRALLLATGLATLAGCQHVVAPPTPQTLAPFEPTAIIIADERGPLDADELARRRPGIIQYLVARGYLQSPDAVVDNPALASRFIRVVLSSGGGFRITEFTLGNRARQIHTTSGLLIRPATYLEVGSDVPLGYRTPLPYGRYDPRLPVSPSPHAYRPPERSPRPGGGHPDRPGPRAAPDGPRAEPAAPPAVTPAPAPVVPPPAPVEPPPAQARGESRYEDTRRPFQP